MTRKMTRRLVLKGVGGAMLALPLLESFPLTRSRAQAAGAPEPFAIFFRQANGVACEQNAELGQEPERFWPTQTGALTADTLKGRALDELTSYTSKLLVCGGINMYDYNYGDGHARGALQGLTGRGPTVEGAGGDSEASGMSLDHRIGAELNPDGRDSLFLYSGRDGDWLGGACISYRSSGVRRAAFQTPKSAFDAVAGTGASGGMTDAAQAQLATRQKSINDLVRAQFKRLLAHPRLSAADKMRLELHQHAVRELEVRVGCALDADVMKQLDSNGMLEDETDGDEIWAAARLHMDIAVMAVACGFTRSVALQIGNGNDGAGRYRDPDTGQLMENFHFISHRRLSHDATGAIIPGSDVLHHKVDRQFGQAFKYLLDGLSAYAMPDGKSLLEHGLAIWYNDLGNGPAHSAQNTPFIIAGSAGGYLKQGQYIKADGRDANHTQMLNTIGAAVGVKNADGGPLDDFGDPMLAKGLLENLLA
jgi:hypothetical protein